MSVIEMLRQLLKRGLPPPDRQPRRSERILEKLGGGAWGNWCNGPTSDITGNMSSARVLVVEDYEPFRRYICSTLERSLDFWIVGEVSDGLQAVHEAEVLQPDLILLDIGLPTLNGIEAARRIRQLSPKSKILFVSQESSPDVIEEALSSGALGYVVKANAARELLPAVAALLQGKCFISRGLTGQDLTGFGEATEEFETDRSDGIFRVEMDSPMPVDLPEEEQIRRIIYDSYVAYCNDCQAKMYGLASARDLIGKRMAEMVVPDDPKNIELTRAFIRSGYQVLERKSYELDSQGNPKVFLNSMRGVVIAGELVLTWGVQSDITERSFEQ